MSSASKPRDEPSSVLPQPGEVEEEVYYEEVEEEVEEEEYDDSLVDATESTALLPAARESTPGKVAISEKVKNMAMRAPSSGAPHTEFYPTANPFPAFGAWTKQTLSQINIGIPHLSSGNETTSQFTKANKPEARYWKGGVVFTHNSYSSESIRFDDVYVPYGGSERYGVDFVYMCLPGFAAEVFRKAGIAKNLSNVGESSLVAEPERWWKICNNVNGNFGIIDNVTNDFHDKPLKHIFEQTKLGIRCNAVLRFKVKASTTNNEALKATTLRRLAVEVERAYIQDIGVDVQPPARVGKAKPTEGPPAVSADIATDDLMKRMSSLGI